MSSGVGKLKHVSSGDLLSVEQANLINRLLRREVTGPNVHADSTGWHIRPTITHPEGFWAKLTAEADPKSGYYSWVRLKSDADAEEAPVETGVHNAKEVNETTHIPDLTIVWMWPDETIRESPPVQPEYRFAYETFFTWGEIAAEQGETTPPEYLLTDERTATEVNGNLDIEGGTIVLVRESATGIHKFEYQSGTMSFWATVTATTGDAINSYEVTEIEGLDREPRIVTAYNQAETADQVPPDTPDHQVPIGTIVYVTCFEGGYDFRHHTRDVITGFDVEDMLSQSARVYPCLVTSIAAGPPEVIKGRVWCPQAGVPHASDDGWHIHTTEVEIHYEKTGDGTWTDGTLVPHLAIDDWVMVRMAKWAVSIFSLTGAINGDNCLFTGAMPSLAHPTNLEIYAARPAPPGGLYRPGSWQYLSQMYVESIGAELRVRLQGNSGGVCTIDARAGGAISATFGQAPLVGDEVCCVCFLEEHCEYEIVQRFQTLEGVTPPPTPGTKSTLGEGWLFVDEDRKTAHGDPRPCTIVPECGAWNVFDARGHLVGWWTYGDPTWFWESPWGHPEPVGLGGPNEP